VFRFPVSASRFPFPVSRFPFQVSGFRFQVSGFRFPLSSASNAAGFDQKEKKSGEIAYNDQFLS
jgi:hypothetical protein